MHLTPEMWRMLPVFWVLGLLGIGFGLPLWLCRVKANPYYGLTIGEKGERDDVWYPVNFTLGRNLTGMGVRTIMISTAFAFVDWRQPWHYLVVAGSFLLAEAMLFGARWRVLGKAVQEAQDEGAAGL
jgi:hypothetical protein